MENAQDYYPFGMMQPGRTYDRVAGGSYRYGFNGKENDNEVKGEGNQQDYGMRVYDPRVGKFLSVDPLMRDYPNQSPYAYAANSPIRLIDVFGMGPGDPPSFKDYARMSYNLFNAMQSKVASRTADRVMPAVLGTLNGVGRVLSFGLYSRSAEDIGLNEQYWSGYDNATLVGQSAPLPSSVGGTGTAPKLALVTESQLTVAKPLNLSINVASTLLANSATGNNIGQNSEDGKAREAVELSDLQEQYPDATIYRERLLRDANGKKVVDPVTGEGRRIDFAVIMDKVVAKLKEVTSQTANKVQQEAKELRIRNAGGTYVKAPGRGGALFNVKDIITEISRRE